MVNKEAESGDGGVSSRPRIAAEGRGRALRRARDLNPAPVLVRDQRCAAGAWGKLSAGKGLNPVLIEPVWVGALDLTFPDSTSDLRV